MEELLTDLWGFLGITAAWGIILTISLLVLGAVLKIIIDHALKNQLEKIEELQNQDAFVRDLFKSTIAEYASEQAHALREAYLILCEPDETDENRHVAKLNQADKIKVVNHLIIVPLRRHIEFLDKSTTDKILDVRAYLNDFKRKSPMEMKRAKSNILSKTDMARKHIRADRIAYRLGLVDHALEERREDRS